MKNHEWKYDVRFCSCGRIHLIPVKKIESAIHANKELVYICSGCGTANAIGADAQPDWDDPDKICYSMYTRDLNPNQINDTVYITGQDFTSKVKDHRQYSEVILSEGIRVPMMTGEYARSFMSGRFCDMWYPDWYKIERKDITVEEIMQFIEKYKKDQRTVNMDRFIADTPEEYIDAIAGYYIEGFDWTGTKWDRNAKKEDK